MPEQHRFVRGLVAWIGFKQVALPYARQKRVAGATKYPLGKMLRFAVDALTGFSVLPLRISSLFGACFGAVGLSSLAYALISWLAIERDAPPHVKTLRPGDPVDSEEAAAGP
jgi:dolichol-phosphate mannosyltransferase